MLAATSQGLPSHWNSLRTLPNAQLRPSSGRIVGGFVVDITDIPFQVAFKDVYGNFCGGSIISGTWVLTAAHCISNSPDAHPSVRAKSTHWNEGGQLVAVKRVVKHPNYNDATVDYDFALLELSDELALDDRFFAADLPQQDEPVEDGSCLQVSGWGNTQNPLEFSTELRATNVPAVNQEKCAATYTSFGEVTPRMLCAGFDKGGKDSCQGDSGGPLVEGGTKLVGVVSWGRGCAEEGFPGVYSRVAAVRDWIKEVSGV